MRLRTALVQRCAKQLTALCAIVWVGLSPVLYADSELAEAQQLDAESLIELAHSDSELIVIDSRVSVDRKLGFIEDSINLPDGQTSCDTLSTITSDKSRFLVFYCNGIKCGRSLKAINIAKECGYQNIYWFKGGFQEWRLKDYPYLME